MSRIITIGREFGSGGREIGKRLSDELGIAYYDNEIISQIADRTKLAEGLCAACDGERSVDVVSDYDREKLLHGS